MEKIKSIFKPGGSHHDEAKYATPEGSSGVGSSGVGSSAAAQNPGHVDLPDHVRTDPGEEKKEHGVLRQILNPGGEKYDEQAYGTTAHADNDPNAPKLGSDGALQTHPAHETDSKDVSRQILNPGGEKYDPVRYGSTAQADKPLGVPSATTVSPSSAPQIEPLPASEDKHSILRQVLNPGGDKYDEQRYGTTGKTIPGTEPSLGSGAGQGVPLRTVSSETVASGMPGPYASNKADKMVSGTEPSSSTTGTSALPDRSRDVPAAAGLASAGAASNPTSSSTTTGEHGRAFPLTGGTTSSATAPHERHGIEETMRGQPSTADQSHLGRDAGIVGAGALGAGALGHHEADRPSHDTSSLTDPTSRAAGSDTLSGQPNTADQSHLGRDAGIVGAGALGAGALGHHEANKLGDNERNTAGGLGSTETGSSTGRPLSSTSSADIPGDPFGYHRPDETPHEGYVHHTHGPHATDTANRLDPHVPGEFPDENGEDRHAHLGRDAALGGAAGASLGALAGHEADHHHGGDSAGLGSTSSTAPSHPISTTTNTVPHGISGTEGSVTDSQRDPEHHYGRDAALAGGAGAAGVAGYEALKDHDRQAPQSQQRAVDPVSSSSGATQPHHGRDAALAGGTGAAGVAGYEALKDHDRQAPQSQQRAVDPVSSSSGTTQPHHEHGHHHHDKKEPVAGSAAHEPKLTAYEAQRAQAPTTSSSEPHHLGRDAAIAGGTGAAGLAGYEALKDHDRQDGRVTDPTTGLPMDMSKGTGAGGTDGNPAIHGAGGLSSSSQPIADSTHPGASHPVRDAALGGGAGAAGLGGASALHNREQQSAPLGQSSDLSSQQQPQESHLGRDAALGAGAGAAGVGGYEALKHHDNQTGPASKTVGPHDSNAANVVDPRVQPEPSKMKEHTTSGPYQSDTLNKADPRVKQDEPKHTGRDAAIAGGAGAAGVGAYEATQDKSHGHNKLEKTPHQVEKHEKDLEKAREKEAKHGGDHGEKKESLLHRILHPGSSSRKSMDEPERGREQTPVGGAAATTAGAAAGAQTAWNKHDSAPGGPASAAGGQSEVVREPHTGLPMDMSKGSGVGGTDGAQQIYPHEQATDAGAGAGTGTGAGAGAGIGSNTTGTGTGTGTGDVVREPHTGLPMDMSKGSGVGGTDGAQQIYPHEQATGAGTGSDTTGTGQSFDPSHTSTGTTGTGEPITDGSGVQPAHGGLTKHDWYGPK